MRSLIERWGPAASLIAISAIWGGTFVLVSDAIESYPMYAFLGWRFALATVAFVAFFPRSLKRLDRANLSAGLVAGVFLTLGYIFQTWGLDGATRTSPARAAFITGLYVVFVPVAQALFLRRRPKGGTVVGVAMAVCGLWLLSGVGFDLTWSLGDGLVVVAAAAYAVHMLILAWTDERHDTVALTLVQLATVAVITGAISLGTEHASLPNNGLVIFAIVVCGVLASALAFAAQTWAQRRMPPARAALILVLEPAFGGLFGWSVAGLWPLKEVAGACLMIGGMITSEIVSARAGAGEHVEFEAAVEGIPALMLDDRDATQHRDFASRGHEPPSRAHVGGEQDKSAIDPPTGAL